MSLLTQYGGLVGYPPFTMGRVFFVAPADSYTINGRTYSASNDNDGLDPTRALRTPQQFVTNASAAVGDVCILLEGTHTVTAVITVNKSGLKFFGVGKYDEDFNTYSPQTIVTSTGTSTNLFNVTADNVEIAYLGLRPTSAFSAVVTSGTTGINGLRVHHCYGDLVTPANSTGTCIIDLTTRSASVGYLSPQKGFSGGATVYATAYIHSNVFQSDGAQGPAVALASCWAYVNDNVFSNDGGGTWASPFVIATAVRMAKVNNNVFLASGVIALPIDGTNALSYKNAVNIYDNVFSVNATVASSFGMIRGFVDTSAALIGRNIVLDGNSTGASVGRSIG